MKQNTILHLEKLSVFLIYAIARFNLLCKGMKCIQSAIFNSGKQLMTLSIINSFGMWTCWFVARNVHVHHKHRPVCRSAGISEENTEFLKESREQELQQNPNHKQCSYFHKSSMLIAHNPDSPHVKYLFKLSLWICKDSHFSQCKTLSFQK